MDEGASLIAWRHVTQALWASRNSNAFASFSANKRTSFALVNWERRQWEWRARLI